MEKKLFKKFYLDKEKDIIVNLYRISDDELQYILETPYHNTGNLITNLAKLCHLETIKDENDMKIITGILPANINGDNKIVYIFRLGGIKIANIYEDGKIEIKATIPAISKTLMSQTKHYNLPIEKTIVKSYILKRSKFKTDLHTHMNATLFPNNLIALGIKHQLKYPLYYIKKLNLKMSKEQETKIMSQRKIVEKKYANSPLTGKYLTRKIDDNTFINFADFILNNLENAEYNISKIRISLSILKDGQAVFTNLEKLYIYRYVFCKGTPSEEKIDLDIDKINQIPENDIKNILKTMLRDNENEKLKNISLRQDKLLWIARYYKNQGIKYVEITNTDLTKPNGVACKVIEEIHEIMPEIEKLTGVQIRFLVGLRRIPLTIIKDQIISGNYLKEDLNVLKAISKSPYVVGSDFMGEEINDISDLKPAISELVKYVREEDENFTIRIHAGENDSLKDNVSKSIKCVKDSLAIGQKMPKIRIGHGLYTADLNSKKGKELIEELKNNNIILEFQLTSNVRLNNLTNLKKHPLKTYLQNNVYCVQGTDGCGFYGTNTIDEQLALQNLLGLDDKDFEKMRKVEDEILLHRKKYFKEKSIAFEKFLNGRKISDALLELENQIREKNKDNNTPMRISTKIESDLFLKNKISDLPTDKVPIIIAGGSFNKKGKSTEVSDKGYQILKDFLKKVNPKTAFFVVGHKMQGYEKAIFDISKELHKNFEIYAIIPKMISKEESKNLQTNYLNGIRISIENDEMGLYKSFNYEIFERRKSIVIAFDGNSPVSNLVQEAKNGKGKSKIYVNADVTSLKDKARSLEGYAIPFNINENTFDNILSDNPEITIVMNT